MFARIRALREDKDWTQKEIADLLKVSQTTYSRYETGELDLPTSALIKLADLHQTSIDYLLNRTDRKEPYPTKKK
ncbi:transcriptional regulator [Cohnella sp. CIP 111063]|jgi:Predicted transcriptional regulator|uniref:helix-turn-helix domain-containing protein n=1 Tax=unclassified Cohnella TaxID=2636738 RepID=UPI000B8BE935|nr:MULTISPECIES: helix-turn-helix transcriptional regulator [unclassified Cohnella]OXS56617.1 transcriptional regulator [Cohnella sp. CIP 111063]